MKIRARKYGLGQGLVESQALGSLGPIWSGISILPLSLKVFGWICNSGARPTGYGPRIPGLGLNLDRGDFIENLESVLP